MHFEVTVGRFTSSLPLLPECAQLSALLLCPLAPLEVEIRRVANSPSPGFDRKYSLIISVNIQADQRYADSVFRNAHLKLPVLVLVDLRGPVPDLR